MADAEGSTEAASDPDVALPVAAIAAQLLAVLPDKTPRILYVARSERRAVVLTRILRGLAPSVEVLPFPAWDCVPYDRAPPSRHVMGWRIATLTRLASRAPAPWIVVTTAEALAQRVPPRTLWEGARFSLRIGDGLSSEELEQFLLRTGYILDDRVDEPGEAAIRGAVIDLFPPGSEMPFRVDHADGQITGIRRYDAATQRTLADQTELLLVPASEVVLPPTQPEEEPVERFAGIEHFLPDYCDRMESFFDYAPGAKLVLDDEAEEAFGRFREQVDDAYETRRSVPRANAGRAPLAPARLYLDADEWKAGLGGLDRLALSFRDVQPVPRFSRERDRARAFEEFLKGQIARGHRIAFAAGSHAAMRTVARAVRGATGQAPGSAQEWTAVLAAPRGSLLNLPAHIDAGFVDGKRELTVIGTADLFGSRSGQGTEERNAAAALGMGDAEMRPGDVVVHLDHGMALLKGIETVAPAGGAAADAVMLEFAGHTKLLLPCEEMRRMWRYGGDGEAVSLDTLGGAGWPKRRAALEHDLADMAARLVAVAAERHAAKAHALIPPRRAYERFAAGFPYSETPDQARAIEDVIEDLASGRPMDRLVCGDVGFGKTEVALRGAAAAVLAGKQVAVVAPTTVLVRQHVQTFRRRFVEMGIEVAHLSRLVKPAEARAVKEGLASGDIRVVIGTHALSGKGVEFKDLGLLIVDEEQRFGAKQKQALRTLGKSIHVLTLTATPIPRTLEAALVGLQDLSVIATPPTRRQPVRTFVTPFDAVTVRAALTREQARGGQSFVVCPRIEDMEPMARRLTELVPELQVVAAHGKMPADEIDRVMVEFADGIGDVLLATNIIESGLDVPRANTILIWRADRFGLSQLHQLRGRVGRGRVRGTSYLLTDPEAKVGKATEQRLRTLEAFDRLGAGFAISGRDLDHRGAGDLLGEEQAGHVKLIGMGLYQHLLGRALAAARGEVLEEEWSPAINLGSDAHIPAEYVPEPEVRIHLHARLARIGPEDDSESLAEEISDRFGPPPEPVQNLIALAEMRRNARRLGIEKLDAGPAAIAATFREGAALQVARTMDTPDGEMEWRGERLVWAKPSETGEERRRLARLLLQNVAGRPKPHRLRRPEREPAAVD